MLHTIGAPNYPDGRLPADFLSRVRQSSGQSAAIVLFLTAPQDAGLHGVFVRVKSPDFVTHFCYRACCKAMDSSEVQIKRIAAAWEVVRLKFLKECLSAIGDSHFKGTGDEIGLPSSENCDSALAVIEAYQLWDGAQFLKDCPYLSSPDSFFGKLYEEIVPMPENRSRASSYFGLFDKTAEEPIRFAKEVVHYLTQSKTPYEAPFEESFRVMYLIPWFCGLSRIVVAKVFGDEETANGISAKIHLGAEAID